MMRLQTIIIMLFLSLSSCYDYNEWAEGRIAEFQPDVTIGSLPISANGVDSLLITVKFPIEADRDLIKVNFSTPEGKFAESNSKEYSSSEAINRNGELRISATLVTSLKAGTYNITIEVPDVYKRTQSVTFEEALPTAIVLSKNKFALIRSYTDEIEFSATLTSGLGKASLGTKVTFIVADTIRSDNSFLFRGLMTSSENGVAKVLFSTGDDFGSNFVGDVEVVAVVGDTRSSTNKFTIIDP